MELFYGEGPFTSAPNTEGLDRGRLGCFYQEFSPIVVANAVSPPLARLASKVQHHHPNDDEPDRHQLYGG
jgi:hypothetical protein